ncbi:hypothetical protein HON36_04895 [Candidatus Parcubacteria bacterium]|jgi:hypothetical protein|nr:hypothetical protein [Candidatus Parcubacteria bacterium]MBT7228864.1 hypothetical protein [Candidatus Parcubacteria bacterium]
MSLGKIKLNINIYKLYKKHKIYLLGVAVFIFILSIIINNAEQILKFNYENYSSRYAVLLNSHLDSDINKLKQDAREISEIDTVRQYIKENNAEKLAPVLNIEKQNRGLKMMLGLNKEGIAIYRGLFSLYKGDYVFQNNDWGQQLALGNRRDQTYRYS